MTKKPARRGLMYLIVAAQLGVLATMIAPQELNRVFDSGPTVDVEIAHARVGRDNFRGAYVYGQSALDLDARGVAVPAGLSAGERVRVTFAVESNRRPRITSIERGRRGAPFTPTSFTVPGRVLDDRAGTRYVRHDGMVARVGTPAVTIVLDLPSSIAVDDAAVARLSGPSLVRASLHAGYLGRPYFTDVRLTGRGWSADMRFVWDDQRERLLVFAPREAMTYVSGGRTPTPSDLFLFDAAGKEVGSKEIEGHVLDATVDAEGQVLALMTSQRWNHSEVSVVRLDEDGRAVERSPPVALDRILGFDVASRGAWILAGPVSSPRKPPYFVQRLTVAGLREPKLGPFESVPRVVVSAGSDAWVVENERHRITRWDASGQQTREYWDLNGPLEIAVDAGGVYVIEANRTQLTRLTEDGRVAWRVPRFQGLTWAIAEPSGGGSIVAASTFEGAQVGLLKVGPDGAITQLPATARPQQRNDWQRRVGGGVVRSARDGRLLFLENEAIAILSADGATLTRVVGFRLPTEQRLRS